MAASELYTLVTRATATASRVAAAKAGPPAASSGLVPPCTLGRMSPIQYWIASKSRQRDQVDPGDVSDAAVSHAGFLCLGMLKNAGLDFDTTSEAALERCYAIIFSELAIETTAAAKNRDRISRSSAHFTCEAPSCSTRTDYLKLYCERCSSRRLRASCWIAFKRFFADPRNHAKAEILRGSLRGRVSRAKDRFLVGKTQAAFVRILRSKVPNASLTVLHWILNRVGFPFTQGYKRCNVSHSSVPMPLWLVPLALRHKAAAIILQRRWHLMNDSIQSTYAEGGSRTWGLGCRLRSDFILKIGRHGLNHHRRPPPFSPTRATRIASRPRPISRGTPNQAQFIAVARTIEVDSSSPSESLDLGIT